MFVEEKEELLGTKKEAEIKNEALRKELLAKQEIEGKKLQASLNKNKTVEIKELIAQEETVKEHNITLEKKVEDERKKYDGLLDEWMDLDEQFRRKTTLFEGVKTDVIS